MSTAFIYTRKHASHALPGHPERPERLDSVVASLRADAVWARLDQIDPSAAREEDLLLVHEPGHLEEIRRLAEDGGGQADPDTYVRARSWECALEAAGALIDLTAHVLDGKARNGFAAVRPPGHHATAGRAMGFCLLSNAAIAARWAQRRGGLGRVLIVDFDVHHGNGTQDIFYDDGSVFFMSVHQWPFYPGTGALHEHGRDAGEGTTLNVPLQPGAGDATYVDIFERILRPHALRFQPELIILSAGFDAHWRDPLADMRLSTAGFADLVREIIGWSEACCDGRLVGVLEGGYSTEALAGSVLATVRLLDKKNASTDDLSDPSPEEEVQSSEYLANLHDLLSSR